MANNKQNTDNKTSFVKRQGVDRKWYVIDAKGKVLGKLACEIVRILRGKRKADFTPHADNGDYVVIINAKDITYTGKNKGQQTTFWRHSGYIGGLKFETLEDLLERRPEQVIINVVNKMLPKATTARSNMLNRLKVYAGEEHQHQAQNPELIEELPAL